MTLRVKTYLTTGVLMLLFVTLVFITSRAIVLEGFTRLEEKITHQAVNRVVNALDDRMAALETKVTDYSVWNDTYAFAADLNDDYITSNMVDGTFDSLSLNVIAIIQPTGKLAFSKAYDLVNSKEAPISPGLLAQIGPATPLFARLNREEGATGIIQTDQGPMLIATHAILTSLGNGPRRGTLLMGRYLDDVEVTHLAQLTNESLDLYAPDRALTGISGDALQSLHENNSILVQPQDAQYIAGYTLLKDYIDQPVLILRVLTERTVYAEALNTLKFFLIAIVISTLAYGAVVMFFLEKSVITRVADLSASVGLIASAGDFSARIKEGVHDELGRLASAINQMLGALDRARKTQQDSDKRQEIELRVSYESTLEGWARAIDMRDDTTGDHSKRVTELAVQLSTALGMTEAQIVLIRRGSLLHDIGKIGIPDQILQKPGPLTEEEWVIMRRHPVLAYELLQPIDYLHSAIDIPYCHHEHWDGTGYPRGLKGEQIPLSARIFSVVDVWDALRSDRPYRKAWSEARSRAYLCAQSGTQLDPQVVKDFLKMMSGAIDYCAEQQGMRAIEPVTVDIASDITVPIP